MSGIINAKTLGGLQQTMDAGNPNHLKLQCDGTTIVTVTPEGLVFDVGTGSGGGSTGPAFSAYASAPQTIANSTAVKLAFDKETYDTDNCFTPFLTGQSTTGRFVASVAGIYHFNWRVQISVAANTAVETKLYRNGSLAVKGTKIGSTSGAQGPIGSSDIVLNVGDYVEVYVEFVDTTSRPTVGAQAETFFNGHFVRSL
jgi:hypothetical protein